VDVRRRVLSVRLLWAALLVGCSDPLVAPPDATVADVTIRDVTVSTDVALRPDATVADVTASDVTAPDVAARDAMASSDVAPRPDVAAPDAALPWSPPIETGDVVFPYRAYRCGHVVRAVAPDITVARFHASVVGASPRPRNLHLTFAGDPSASVVIQWSTDADTLATEVRFGDRMGALDRVARGFSFTYAGGEGRRQHEVHLCGLDAGRTYVYDVGGEGARSAAYRFVTAPSGPSEVTALVTGDTRTNVAAWNAVTRRALTEGADLLIFTGDAVEWGGDQAQWDALFDASPEFWATTPAVWTHGNHEGLALPYFAQLALPDHGGARGVEQWYALTYGPLRIVALNDTVERDDDVTVAQAAFLREAVAGVSRARAPYLVTTHHQPFYTTSLTHPSATWLRAAWAPVFDALHVHVDLAGHVHSYESSLPLRGGTVDRDGVAVTASMGTRYLTFGGGGADLYDFGDRAPWLVARESVHGYGVLTASSTRLQWAARRDDGSLIETLDLLR
jgi:Purple acid Phosphatase, N-terminal domain/Calcineurin-like phosphoesterase/Iron/zinc purple acid phosphatase-like protein C